MVQIETGFDSIFDRRLTPANTVQLSMSQVFARTFNLPEHVPRAPSFNQNFAKGELSALTTKGNDKYVQTLFRVRDVINTLSHCPSHIPYTDSLIAHFLIF